MPRAWERLGNAPPEPYLKGAAAIYSPGPRRRLSKPRHSADGSTMAITNWPLTLVWPSRTTCRGPGGDNIARDVRGLYRSQKEKEKGAIGEGTGWPTWWVRTGVSNKDITRARRRRERKNRSVQVCHLRGFYCTKAITVEGLYTRLSGQVAYNQ